MEILWRYHIVDVSPKFQKTTLLTSKKRSINPGATVQSCVKDRLFHLKAHLIWLKEVTKTFGHQNFMILVSGNMASVTRMTPLEDPTLTTLTEFTS